MIQNRNRILIAGTHSGCGKTTITCGVLRALQNRGMDVRAFKCGPDYIDPMFHREVIGAQSRNIDFFLCPHDVAKDLFIKNTSEDSNSIAVVEGVMGYYDGLGGNRTENSTYYISEELGIPTILVVDCKGASLSVVATIQGYQNYRSNQIVGVILNQVSPMMLPFYREMIEEQTGLEVLGCLPKEPDATIGSRHLGLITAGEIANLNQKIDLLGNLVEKHVNLDRLITISQSASQLEYQELKSEGVEFQGLHIGVAWDKAFCFYYQDGLQTLEDMGATLHYFSPLTDEKLPEHLHGIIFGGGYPELYLQELSENQSMLESIRQADGNQMPIYGECGGYMYLGKSIDGYAMAGIIDMKSEMTARLQNFGYARLTPFVEGTLVKDGANAHEFHYSKSDMSSFVYEAKKITGKTWQAGYCSEHVFAQYPHLHFSGEVEVASAFLHRCKSFQSRKRERNESE